VVGSDLPSSAGLWAVARSSAQLQGYEDRDRPHRRALARPRPCGGHVAGRKRSPWQPRRIVANHDGLADSIWSAVASRQKSTPSGGCATVRSRRCRSSCGVASAG